jgi:TatD DNase family protein
MEWAKDMALPIVIHTREAFPMIFDLVEEAQDGRLKGVFHCFSGSCEDAKRILDLGFLYGNRRGADIQKVNLARCS